MDKYRVFIHTSNCKSVSSLYSYRARTIKLFILMDYPKHIDTISMTLSILHFKGLRFNISIKTVYIYPSDISLKIVFIVANSADPDEMSLYATFHLGLHCLPKYLFAQVLVYEYTK